MENIIIENEKNIKNYLLEREKYKNKNKNYIDEIVYNQYKNIIATDKIKEMNSNENYNSKITTLLSESSINTEDIMITENKIENESEVDNSNLNYDSKRNMNPFEFSEELNTETVTVNKENNIQRNLTEIMMTEEATTFSEKIMENPMKSRKENNQVINPKISFDMVTENQKILSESESESESKLKSKFETENEFIPETDDEKKIKKNEDKITIHTTESIKKRKDNNEYKEAYYNNATEIETIRKNQILEEEKEKENEKEKK
jgi:hypothetical protein